MSAGGKGGKGLRSIASAVAGFSRGTVGLPDRAGPLDAIGAAWPAIVGPDVARHSAPLDIVGSTLVVATRSSAWSQQLQFLEGTILPAVRALPSAGHVERLRFRSGGLAPRAKAAAFGRTATSGVRRPAAAEPPAESLAEALDRLRARFAERDRVRRASLEPRCGRCGGALRTRDARARYCAPCEEETTRERIHAAQRLLYETPWFSRDAVLDCVPGLTHDEYDRARRMLLSRWFATLERARRTRVLARDRLERRIASSYVILQSRLPPDRISPAIVRSVLGDDLAALLFGDPDAVSASTRAGGAESAPPSAKTPRRE